MQEKNRSNGTSIEIVCCLIFLKNTLKFSCEKWQGWRESCGFVRAAACGLVFCNVSLMIRLCQSKIACVLKLEHLIAPAGPSRVKTSGKQLQALGFSCNVGFQHLCRRKDEEERSQLVEMSLSLFSSRYFTKVK